MRITGANPNSLRGEIVRARARAGLTIMRRAHTCRRNEVAMQIEMTIKGLMVDPITNMPIIILRDKDGQRVLPIWVGVVRGERHRAADRERRRRRGR